MTLEEKQGLNQDLILNILFVDSKALITVIANRIVLDISIV